DRHDDDRLVLPGPPRLQGLDRGSSCPRLAVSGTSTMKAAALLLALRLLTPESAPDVQRWRQIADSTRNAFDEAVITARASEVVDGKVTGSTDFEVYTKGRDRGIIVFRSGSNSGRKVLTDGPKMWLIIPGATRPIPVTPNQRLMGGASMADV